MQRPTTLLHFSGTRTLFVPGKFLFNARAKNRISLRLLAMIEPGQCQSAGELRVHLERIFAESA